MKIDSIEKKIKKIIQDGINKEIFIYDFLSAFEISKTTIKRLKDGNSNISKEKDKLIWKKWMIFKEVYNKDLNLEIIKLKDEVKYDERFLIVTNYEYILAIDTKTNDKLDIKIELLENYFDFFLPLAGMEKAQYQNENQADIKAAERMAKLFDEIKKDNNDTSDYFIHDLNIFFTRLLFCYFAEDTGIFEKNIFVKTLSSVTNPDGSDLEEFLKRLFKTLDTKNIDRKNISNYLDSFPYVNGGLFRKEIILPKFTSHSRRAIIEAGELKWNTINPDIFGSMFQGVISSDKRSERGMHYTSVPNIMKVINPLFLDNLRDEMEKAAKEKTTNKLEELLKRIGKIKIFDPACGSGNFLIIAYKELRRLELDIYNKIQNRQMLMLRPTGIHLNNFYGIEIDDFACEIGKLALWITEHQMHIEAEEKFGYRQPTLPLQETGKIICGNATRLDWNTVCPISPMDEVYVLGNPPYIGSKNQTKIQKLEMKEVLKEIKGAQILDYISIWFYLGAEYIRGKKASFSFVSTNSIVQGEQVAMIWPKVLREDLEIGFAYKPFKWLNNAKAKAGVTCVIIGIRNIINTPKYIYTNTIKVRVKNINSYLLDASNIYLDKKKYSISGLPKMIKGNMPYDGGNLILSDIQKQELESKFPEIKILLKKLIGSEEFINGPHRWCLFIKDEMLDLALSISEIKKRINATKNMRLASSDKGAHKLAERAHQFREMNFIEESSLVIPSVSSERREYVPIGFVDENFIVTNLAFVIYEASPYIMSIISSKLHMIWVKIVSGYLGTSLRYSNVLSYNTFPFPNITKKQREKLEECVLKILDIREKYSEKTLAQLYDPNKMPEDLREAHKENDLAIEKCYRVKPFENDEERLEYLFKLYEKMTINKE